MHSQIIKQAPRDEAIVTIATAIRAANPGDDVALDVVQKAYLEARALRDEAVAQARRIAEEARQEGLARARAEFGDALDRMARMIEGLARATVAAAEDAAPIVADLAIEVAARILGREIAAQPAAVASMVADAVARLARTVEVTVRVHPDDLAVIAPHREHLEEIAGGHVRIVGDNRVDGGCLVESASGVVDARFSSQLREMRRALHEALQEQEQE